MTRATEATEAIEDRINAIAVAHGVALTADPAAWRALAGLRAVQGALAADTPPDATSALTRARPWVDAIEAALAGDEAGRRDVRAGERVADVQRQLDDHLAEAVERAAPAWRAAWLVRLVRPVTAVASTATRAAGAATLLADGARERACWIVGAVLERAGLATWDPSWEPEGLDLAADGSLELFARTTTGERPGELVRARIAADPDGAPTEARIAIGYAVSTAAAHRGCTLGAWLASGPTESERAHLAFALVEHALASSPGDTVARSAADHPAPDPTAIRVGGVVGSPVPVGDPAPSCGTWDDWSAMLDSLDVAQARFEDLPANLGPLADRLAEAIAATPRWQLGRLGERSAQIRAWFGRLADALAELDVSARTRGWPLGRRAARVDSGALDVAMGDPDDAAAQRRTIAEELIPYYARPYQIALMGVFSSGKTLLINKLLLAMAGLPLAPYEPDPPYRRDPRYAALKPYLRRSTAEPTDTVVTILRAPRPDDDPTRVRDLLALIAKPRPAWPSDPVELPVPLPDLETMNLVDTPGLNEDLSVNRRVGAFLQSCDLIVYVFSATGVMNSQDHFLIRRLHEVAPAKRMVFAINMIDTLVNRVEHTAFWDGEHEKAVVKAALPLRARIKHEVGRLTGVEPPLVLGEDFWVTSGAYDYQVERLYRHLRSLIERTAALDRLRATPGVLRTHLRWAREFARDHLERELRPRRAAVVRAIEALQALFGRELPRRMDEDKEQALVQFARHHTLADPVFPVCPLIDRPAAAPDDPPVPWAVFRGIERLELADDRGAAALARVLEDAPTVQAWTSAVAGNVLATVGCDAWTAGLGRFDRELASAVQAARAATGAAFDAFADALLPARVSAVGTALGRQIALRCAALAAELNAEYQRRWGVVFGAPGSPEEPAARALAGAPRTVDGTAAGDRLDAPRRAVGERIDLAFAELAAMSRELGTALATAPGRVLAALAQGVDRLRDGGALRRAHDAASARRAALLVVRHRIRVAGAAGPALLLGVAALAGGWTALVHVVLAAGGAVVAWWSDRRVARAFGDRERVDEAALARAWSERLAAFDVDLARCRADAEARAAEWTAAGRRLGEAAVAHGHALAADYRSSVRELFRSGSLAPWLGSVDVLATARIAPLEALRDALDGAIGAAERAQTTLATGELAGEAAALDVLARAHDRHARACAPGGGGSREV